MVFETEYLKVFVAVAVMLRTSPNLRRLEWKVSPLNTHTKNNTLPEQPDHPSSALVGVHGLCLVVF